MALAPCERYPSALSLAADIERWLADEPVSAWSDPWPERARRWVRRHQPLVAGWAAAVGVALVALGVAVPLLSLAWRNELTARRDERRQRILAISKANEAEASKNKANGERAAPNTHSATWSKRSAVPIRPRMVERSRSSICSTTR